MPAPARSDIDWQRLLSAIELHWEVLLMNLHNFRFVYPMERDCVPLAADEPARLHDRHRRTGFADVVGKGIEENHERHD